VREQECDAVATDQLGIEVAPWAAGGQPGERRRCGLVRS
jgi:hypothetical protein